MRMRLRLDGETKHGSHDQRSHGNWARDVSWDDAGVFGVAGGDLLVPNPLYAVLREQRRHWGYDDPEERAYSPLGVDRTEETVRMDRVVSTQEGLRTIYAEDAPDPQESRADGLPVVSAFEDDDGEEWYSVLDGNHRLARRHARGLPDARVVVERPRRETKHGGPGVHSTGTPQAVHGSGVGVRPDGTTFRVARLEPVGFLADMLGGEADEYRDIMASPELGPRIKQAYDDLPEVDNSPEVVAAHVAFMRETEQQFEMLTGVLGVEVVFEDDDPYPDVDSMVADLRENRRLRVFRATGTASTGGHPFVPPEAINRFRAVHDAFGHAATGRGFDRHGEEAAWAAHSSMYGPEARKAMTTATRGQNSSMVWGGDGFPVQKMALLPDWAVEAPPERRTEAQVPGAGPLPDCCGRGASRIGVKHGGPGPHDGTGSPQSVHAGSPGMGFRVLSVADVRAEAERLRGNLLDRGMAPEMVEEMMGSPEDIGVNDNVAPDEDFFEALRAADSPWFREALERYPEVEARGFRERTGMVEGTTAGAMYNPGPPPVMEVYLSTMGSVDIWKDGPVPGLWSSVDGAGIGAAIRHEFAHHIETEGMPEALVPLLDKAWEQRSYLGPTGGALTGYAGTDRSEFFAEAFAIATEPTTDLGLFGTAARDLLQAIRDEYAPTEAKHPGPGGAPVHSTGTPQGAHGGSPVDLTGAILGMKRTTGSAVLSRIEEAASRALDIGPEDPEDVEGLEGLVEDTKVLLALHIGRDYAPQSWASAIQPDAIKRLNNVMRVADRMFEGRPEGMSDEEWQSLQRDEAGLLGAYARGLKERMQHLSVSVSPTDDLDAIDVWVNDPDTPGASEWKATVSADVAQDVADLFAFGDYDALYALRDLLALISPGDEDALMDHAGEDDEEGVRRSMERGTSRIIQSWAQTSNDNSKMALTLQDVAEDWAREKGLVDNRTAGWEDAEGMSEAENLSPRQREMLTAVLDGMYARTQAWFEERGITEVEVYRGQHNWTIADPEAAFAEEMGDEPDDLQMPSGMIGEYPTDEVLLRPLTSWSTIEQTSRQFTTSRTMDAVARRTFPVEKVLCHPHTGFGCLSETELVVLGGTYEVEWELGGDDLGMKHGGPGPHSTGTPQAAHGSGATFTDGIMDAIPLRRDAGKGKVLDGEDEWAKYVADLIPPPEEVEFRLGADMRDVLTNDEHPLHTIVSRAVAAAETAGRRGAYHDDPGMPGSGVSVAEVDEALEALEEAVIEFEGVWFDRGYKPDGFEEQDAFDAEMNEVDEAAMSVMYLLDDEVVYEARQDYIDWSGDDVLRLSSYNANAVAYSDYTSDENVAAALKNRVAETLLKSITEDEAEVLNRIYSPHGSAGDKDRYRAVNSVISAWAQSSNDNHAPSLLAQDGAVEEFGLDTQTTSEWETPWAAAIGGERISQVLVEEDGVVSNPAASAQRKVLRAMYGATQEFLEGQGITEVRLFRGQKEWDGKDRPMASWSANESTAAGFAGGSYFNVDEDDPAGRSARDALQSGVSGNVLRFKTFPAEQILALPGLGFGCLNEYETVVLSSLPREFRIERDGGGEQLRLPGIKHADHDQSTHGNRYGGDPVLRDVRDLYERSNGIARSEVLDSETGWLRGTVRTYGAETTEWEALTLDGEFTKHETRDEAVARVMSSPVISRLEEPTHSGLLRPGDRFTVVGAEEQVGEVTLVEKWLHRRTDTSLRVEGDMVGVIKLEPGQRVQVLSEGPEPGVKHGGPGPHQSTGSPQAVHGRGQGGGYVVPKSFGDFGDKARPRGIAAFEALDGRFLGEFDGTPVYVTVEAMGRVATGATVAGALRTGPAADDPEIGAFGRYVYEDEVEHSSFRLQDAYRRKGIGGAFIRAAAEEYAKAGVEKVTVTTADDGVMVWAAMGFRFDGGGPPGYFASTARDFKRLAERLRQNIAWTREDVEAEKAEYGAEDWWPEAEQAYMREALDVMPGKGLLWNWLAMKRGEVGNPVPTLEGSEEEAWLTDMEAEADIVLGLLEETREVMPREFLQSAVGRIALQSGWSGFIDPEDLAASGRKSVGGSRVLRVVVEPRDPADAPQSLADALERKHGGPGPHDTGTPQQVHAGRRPRSPFRWAPIGEPRKRVLDLRGTRNGVGFVGPGLRAVADTINLGDEEKKAEVTRWAERSERDFPYPWAMLRSLRKDSEGGRLSDGVAAQYRGRDMDITLNKRWFGAPSFGTWDAVTETRSAGAFAHGDMPPAEGVLTHEFGHHLHHVLRQSGYDDDRLLTDLANALERERGLGVRKPPPGMGPVGYRTYESIEEVLQDPDSPVASQVSRYAATSPQEFFAEAYLMSHQADAPASIKEFRRRIDLELGGRWYDEEKARPFGAEPFRPHVFDEDGNVVPDETWGSRP